MKRTRDAAPWVHAMTGPLAFDRAFRRGDLAAVRAALGDPEGFPNCRLPGTHGSVLEYAVYHSPLAFIRRLLEIGATPVYEDHAGFPPLIAALSTDRADKYEIIEALLAAENKRGRALTANAAA
jgi:hypothetical protein